VDGTTVTGAAATGTTAGWYRIDWGDSTAHTVTVNAGSLAQGRGVQIATEEVDTRVCALAGDPTNGPDACAGAVTPTRLNLTASGEPVRLVDPDGVTTLTFYGSKAAGPTCPALRACLVVTGAGTTDEARTVTTYTDAGLPHQVTEAHGTTASGGSPGATTTTHTYDAAGRLTKVETPLTNTGAGIYPLEYGYDAAGRTLWVSAENNPFPTSGVASVAYTYTGADHVATETTWIGPGATDVTVTINTYDKNGQLVSTTTGDDDTNPNNASANEATTTYHYEPYEYAEDEFVGGPGGLGRLVWEKDPWGTVTAYEYDEDGNQTARIVDPGGAHLVWATGYDKLGRVACETDPLDSVPAIPLDCSPSSVTLSLNADAGSFRLVVDGQLRGPYAYNISTASLQTALRAVTDNDTTVTGTAGSSYLITWGDDRHHQLVAVKATLTYDNEAADAWIFPLPEETFAATYEYNSTGQVTRTLRAPGEAAGTITETAYDGLGRQTTTKAETGLWGENSWSMYPYRYDVVEERTYTTAGRLLDVIVPPKDHQIFTWSSGTGKVTTRHAYDNAGRLKTVTDAYGTSIAATTTTTYDDHGWTLSTTTPTAGVTYQTYDALGRVTTTNRPSGSDNDVNTPVDESRATNLVTYTATGQVATETDFALDPTASGTPTRQYSYTRNGWTASVTDALGTRVDYAYDLRGNRTRRTSTQEAGAAPNCSSTDDKCIVETWTYNANNTVATATKPAGDTASQTTTTSFFYDTAGRVEYSARDVGDEWACNYTDYSGHLVTQQTDSYWDGSACYEGTDTWSQGAYYSFDAVGNRVYMEDDLGETFYTYDAAGRLVRRDDPSGETLKWGWTIGGLPRKYVHNDGATLWYAHDALDRLTMTATIVYTVTVPYAEYSYNDQGKDREVLADNENIYREWTLQATSGRPIRYEQDFNGVEQLVTDLQWRPDGRLGSEATSDNCRWYDYDDAGQIVAVLEDEGDVGTCNAGDELEEFSYDGHGNRTSHIIDGVTTTYSYNLADQLTLADAATGTDTAYTYDPVGRRLTTDPTGSDITSYTWDPRDRIAHIDATVSSTEYDTELSYDGDGQLTGYYATVGEAEVNATFVWDPTQPIPQITDAVFDGAEHHRQNYGLRRINSASGNYSYNWMDSTIESGGYPDHPTDFTAYGVPADSPASGPIYLGFGYRSELHIGGNLIYLRNRLYDPTTGTFLSPDPLDGVDGTPTVASAYHYADNDPLNKMDPLGLRPPTEELFGLGASRTELSVSGWGPFDCFFSCPPFSPPDYYGRKEFDIHGAALTGRGYGLNQCIFFGRTCSSASGKPRSEATAQAHAVRELSSHHGEDSRCTRCDKFQHVRDIFWEVQVPAGRIDILVKQDDPLVDIYEVKLWGRDPFSQLSRYTRSLEGMDLTVSLGTELTGWAVKYKVNGTDHVAWQDTAGVVWYSPVPDSEGERQRYPELKAVYDRAKRVEESDPFGGSPGSGPIPIPIPIRPPVPV
jgi:RHS repeat-associated protein